MALLKNHLGEYNYHFNWMDENGSRNGFNDVWAKNKKLAIKKAKEMESEARWSLYDEEAKKYIKVDQEVFGKGHCFRNTGMYLDESTLRKVSAPERDRIDKIGFLMTC